jgi:hypothetical protein
MNERMNGGKTVMHACAASGVHSGSNCSTPACWLDVFVARWVQAASLAALAPEQCTPG